MKIYIITGEKSGDQHASQIVYELKKQFNDIEVRAWGGNALKSVDAGTTWNDLPIYSSSVSGSFNRAEIAVSHNTANILYSALEMPPSCIIFRFIILNNAFNQGVFNLYLPSPNMSSSIFNIATMYG